MNLLKGAKNMLATQSNVKIAICAYLRKNDERDITKILRKNHFSIELSKGYILTIWEKKLSLRKGVIRGYK